MNEINRIKKATDLIETYITGNKDFIFAHVHDLNSLQKMMNKTYDLFEEDDRKLDTAAILLMEEWIDGHAKFIYFHRDDLIKYIKSINEVQEILHPEVKWINEIEDRLLGCA